MTKYFLLTFDVDNDRLLGVEEFGRDFAGASDAYSSKEQAARDDERRRLEVVLLGAESLDVIRRTHSNWFDEEDGDSIEDQFQRLLQSA